jgi:hypothetical protein
MTIKRVEELRAELHSRYTKVLGRFGPGNRKPGPLPGDLQPSAIAALFDDLERALDDLERETSRAGLEDAMDHVDQTHDVKDLLAAVEEKHADVQPQLADPTLRLDTPEALLLALERSDEDFSFSVRRGGEHDRAALARYRERIALLPENQQGRMAAAADALEWSEQTLPADTTVTIYRVPDYSEGNLAALARFSELDPRFSGRGYEVQIRLPDGTTFRPDGIRWFDPRGRRYQFLESKEPYTWTAESFYATAEGQRRLRTMLERDARIAQALQGDGCQGFRYETGHPDLDRFIAEAIADMRTNGVAGAQFLSAPGGG